jgi:potassium-transporting ATPase potassium-binding subunit
MTFSGILQIAIFCIVIIALTRPFGGYITRVFKGEKTFLSPIFRPIEAVLYKIAGVDPEAEQDWLVYGAAMLLFSLAGAVPLYGLMRFQDVLPLNPQGMAALSPDLALNTAISFVTTTNWQSYAGESTMSYLTQMLGLTGHNFLTAATSIALALALIRGFARRSSKTIGNFWVDITRCTFYILLPISFVYALVLVWQGVPQTLSAYVDATTLEGVKQTIAIGPVASQEAIKMLGTNGGGFFNANSAHPFENPTALTNFIQIVSLLSIGAALTNVFGRMVGAEKQGWAIFGGMGLLFLAGIAVVYPIEAGGNPAIAAMGVDQHASLLQAGGNMEGKEVRFGIANSALFATIATDTSCGAVNAMLDSFMPLAGMIPMINIQLGEVIFGGVGSGLYGMLMFAIIAVFVAGLMVGRTPEYLGKKVETREVKMAMLAILVLPLSILGFSAVASVLPETALVGLNNAGPHGFSEVLYAYTSATGNNGSAFAGLSANTIFWNSTLAVAMFVGRFLFIVPMLAVAGSVGAKKIVPPSSGTFPTDGPLFVGLLIGVILIVGGLTFFPALALGPIVEHLALSAGSLF